MFGKLMRKIMGVPENISSVQFSAESLEDAEKVRDRMINVGILPHKSYAIRTGDGKNFTIEEYVPMRSLEEMWAEIDAAEREMMAEIERKDLVPEDAFDIVPDDFFDWLPEEEIII